MYTNQKLLPAGEHAPAATRHDSHPYRPSGLVLARLGESTFLSQVIDFTFFIVLRVQGSHIDLRPFLKLLNPHQTRVCAHLCAFVHLILKFFSSFPPASVVPVIEHRRCRLGKNTRWLSGRASD